MSLPSFKNLYINPIGVFEFSFCLWQNENWYGYGLISPQVTLKTSTISIKLDIAKAAPIKFVLSDTDL